MQLLKHQYTAHSALSNKIINKMFSFFIWGLRSVKVISFILSRVNRKCISVLLRLNADKIIPKKMLNSDVLAVTHEINKTQPLALNVSSIYE